MRLCTALPGNGKLFPTCSGAPEVVQLLQQLPLLGEFLILCNPIWAFQCHGMCGTTRARVWYTQMYCTGTWWDRKMFQYSCFPRSLDFHPCSELLTNCRRTIYNNAKEQVLWKGRRISTDCIQSSVGTAQTSTAVLRCRPLATHSGHSTSEVQFCTGHHSWRQLRRRFVSDSMAIWFRVAGNLMVVRKRLCTQIWHR